MNETDQCASIRIISSISYMERHRRRYLNEQLKSRDLSGSMYLALIFLHFHPGSSQDQLCADLVIDKGNAARLCRQLEDMGYISRQPSPRDRRQNMLYLTDAGKEIVPCIQDYMEKWHEAATEGLTTEERETLAHLLHKGVENIDSFLSSMDF